MVLRFLHVTAKDNFCIELYITPNYLVVIIKECQYLYHALFLMVMYVLIVSHFSCTLLVEYLNQIVLLSLVSFLFHHCSFLNFADIDGRQNAPNSQLAKPNWSYVIVGKNAGYSILEMCDLFSLLCKKVCLLITLCFLSQTGNGSCGTLLLNLVSSQLSHLLVKRKQ